MRHTSLSLSHAVIAIAEESISGTHKFLISSSHTCQSELTAVFNHHAVHNVFRQESRRKHALGRPIHAYVVSNRSIGLPAHCCNTNTYIEGLDPLMVKYNTSLPFDRLFYAEDIAGSIAFARANLKGGILTQEEFDKIEQGFAQIKEEWRTDTFVVQDNDEDIHTANERRLSEIIGKDVGGKLHTGRSRNEQVATDMRLWLREELRQIEGWLQDLIKCSVSRAEMDIDILVCSILSGKVSTNGLSRCPDTLISKKHNPFAGRTGFFPMPLPSLSSLSVSAKSLSASIARHSAVGLWPETPSRSTAIAWPRSLGLMVFCTTL